MTLTLRDPAFLGAGVPSVPWTPAQLGANLRLWLDADDASTISLNGSTVSQWRDKSGLANHMSQPIAAQQMTYQTSAVNGRAAVVDLGAPGANVFMQTSATLNVNFNGSGMSMFGVGRTDSSANGGLSRFIFVNNRIWLGTWFTNSSPATQHGSVSCVFGNGTTWALRGTSLVAWEDTLRIVGATVTSGGSSTTYNDGSTGATNSMGWANFAGQLGLNHVSGGSQQWRGPMCELVMMVDVLGTSDRQKLEGYLAHKWQGAGASNNLPAGHPFKSVPPTV